MVATKSKDIDGLPGIVPWQIKEALVSGNPPDGSG